ncbi:MAG TPA: septum formation initiator family protein [Terriglobia bacterium]|nr:septum formation initiator family protein [Terriglobia bacterium]
MRSAGKLELIWERHAGLCDPALRLLARGARLLYLSRRKLATVAVALLAVVIGYHAIFGENGALVYQKKKAEYRQLQNDVQQLQSENDKLSQQIHALKTDPKAIEREAREQLRYAKPGEVVYLLPAPPQKDANVDAKK